MESLKVYAVAAALAVGLCSQYACTGAVDGANAGGVVGVGTGGNQGNGTGASGGAASGTGAVVGSGGNGNAGGPTGTGAAGGSPVAVMAPGNPGVLVVRRLNRTEYNNTVADLLGTKLTPATDFPADDLGGDFDTVGAALSLSPNYVIAYEKAAYALVTDLFADATRRARVVTCNVDTAGDACAQTVLTAFARRAWRRPVTAAEAQTLMLPVTTARTLGTTPTEGLRHALAAVLMSPFFIFKLEVDPDPASLVARRLGPHELATRLSYALWSSAPDDALAAAADAGQLSTDEQVAAQVDRMMTDARAASLLDTFMAEWLDTQGLESHEVQPTGFPKYTPTLLRSMRLEARRFTEEFLRSDRPVTEMLTARYTFLDSGLAAYYGIPRTAPAGTAATDFVRVDTSAVPRAGLLTLGAFLTTTSLPSRTSPVKRGEFVFSRLLCGTVPPPPPDVPTLPEASATAGLTLRQRTELHRKDPACSPCHNLMDPIGFGLEKYDALGAYRATEGTAAIDATGTLPDGTTFNGAVELATALSRDGRFLRCVTNKFVTFAIGRLLNQKDDPIWVDYLSNRAAASNGSFRAIVRATLLSDAFRSRQPRAM